MTSSGGHPESFGDALQLLDGGVLLTARNGIPGAVLFTAERAILVSLGEGAFSERDFKTGFTKNVQCLREFQLHTFRQVLTVEFGLGEFGLGGTHLVGSLTRS